MPHAVDTDTDTVISQEIGQWPYACSDLHRCGEEIATARMFSSRWSVLVSLGKLRRRSAARLCES
jgi:hypothetical protein